jgi:hypothetical protein
MQSRPLTCARDRADGRNVDARLLVLDNWNTTVPVALDKMLESTHLCNQTFGTDVDGILHGKLDTSLL